METKKIYVSFHVGRGGHFNNPGHLSFHGEEDFQDLIRRCEDVCIIENEDENGNTLPDEDWKLVDTGGNVILEGREKIEAKTGYLEWDTIYDTDYVTTVDELGVKEKEVIWKAYLDEEYMSDKLKDALCTMMGFLRAHNIKRYPTNLEVFTQDGNVSINIDGMCGEFTREEWNEDLEERGFCPLSVEKILDYMEDFCYTNTEDFFK